MRRAPVLAVLAVLAVPGAGDAEIDLRPQGRAVVRAETAALLLSGQEGGDVRLAVAAVPLPETENVTVLIEIDGASLLADAPSSGTDVFVYALSSQGEVLASASRRLAVDLERFRERLGSAGLRVVLALALPPGEHGVRVLVRSETGGIGLASARVAVPASELPSLHASPRGWVTAVTADDEAALAAAWTRLGLEEPWLLSSLPVFTAEEAPAALLPTAVEAAARPRRREIAALYAGALRRLAGGERDAALAALYELESRALAGLAPEALRELQRAQAETVAAVVKRAPAALLPIVLLHADAVRGYRAAGRSALVAHSEIAVAGLARSLAARADQEGRCFALRILAGLAEELQRLGTLGRAEALYREALAIDPGDGGVALALAAVYERLGRFADAVETLGSSRRPGPEARLRLAVNLLRTRRPERGERLLRRLADDEDAGWVRVLAWQELATLELTRGAPDAAATVLRRALAGRPGHPALELQLAFVLDRLGRRDEAGVLLAALAGGAPRPEAGERSRYNEWPRPELGTRCPELETRAAEGREALARALEGRGP